ncbi:septum formation initiator family protein [Sphingobacteriaceae bacterium WQ 2009]|uniref:Septum formation initiator family protein n=1 Tax=Rhinopithecimicrobium faecis TaxID=2820698 RepID=A0A8T4HC23_9SPHI|nr:septum formation initiator family protein [Sphingobacteriaceae bacterium WQ 2009]
MERLLNLIKNKYLITFLSFVVWMLFFDRNDVATQYSYQKQKANLQEEKDFYVSENAKIEATLKNIRYNAEEVQRIAREKYKMKKDNEDIYIVVEAPKVEEEN